MEPPRKPSEANRTALPPLRPAIIREEDARPHERLERKSRPGDEPMADTDREFILGKLHEQTEYIVEKIEDVRRQSERDQRDNERRFNELEKARVEDQAARVAMQEVSGQVRELNGNVRTLIESDRHQNQDIGALSARVAEANRPAVKAEAASEGMVAGAAAGKSASRFWSIMGIVLATVATSGLQYCEHQISAGAFEAPKK